MLTRAHRVRRFHGRTTAVGTAVARMMEFFERFDEQKYGTDGGPLTTRT